MKQDCLFKSYRYRHVKTRASFSACAGFLLLQLLSFNSQASQTVINSQRFCSDNGDLCLRGSITINTAKALAELNARVLKTTYPGYLRITLIGKTPSTTYQGFIQGNVEGKYSERLNFKNGASHSDEAVWEIYSFEYIAK